MLNVSRSLPDIAILRGGSEEFGKSLMEGAEVLASLKKIGYQPLDVLIDRDGTWTLQGVPTDAHAIFARAHTIVDTTRAKSAPHHALAKKMGVTLLFSAGNTVHTDRENLYRILRMQGIRVPDTIVVRSNAPLEDSLFRDVWSRYNTPLMLRPLVRNSETPSKLVNMYADFETSVRDYHEKGVDIHILTFRKAPVSSLTLLPQFRGEDLYMPVWIENFSSLTEIPKNTASAKLHFNAPGYRKEQMKEIARKIYEAAELAGPAVIDIIPFKDEYIVVNIEERPSLTGDSRFSKSLDSTGADVGQYIHAQIEKEYLNNRDEDLTGYDRER